MGAFLADLFLALEQSGLGAAMRGSSFLYPLSTVLHIVGLACFAGAIAIMDARLLGAFAPMPLKPFVSRWRQAAAVAFAVQAVSGFLLFSAEASAIAENPVFQFKVLLIVLGLANVAAFEIVTKPEVAGWKDGPPPTAARVSGALSLLIWAGVATLGRLIAYF
jgi:hypothetical protein